MKQKLITEFFVNVNVNIKTNKQIQAKIFGFNSITESWHCVECGEDMGKLNPRQLCGKTFCFNFEC